MRLIKDKTSIDFLSHGRRRITTMLSILAVVVSIGSIATKGLEYGIDFTGGVLLEVGYPEEANLERPGMELMISCGAPYSPLCRPR